MFVFSRHPFCSILLQQPETTWDLEGPEDIVPANDWVPVGWVCDEPLRRPRGASPHDKFTFLWCRHVNVRWI